MCLNVFIITSIVISSYICGSSFFNCLLHFQCTPLFYYMISYDFIHNEKKIQLFNRFLYMYCLFSNFSIEFFFRLEIFSCIKRILFVFYIFRYAEALVGFFFSFSFIFGILSIWYSYLIYGIVFHLYLH